jgi:predicted pyridoxine 5'-phosphate oxidase superfamily flavin-nucleotide-binding protein
LEPHTRRRNRANGRVGALHDDRFEVQVLQSFGNCPKYIHARRPETRASTRVAPSRRLGPLLDPSAVALLRRADTLFIASANARARLRAPTALTSRTAAAGRVLSGLPMACAGCA